MRRVQYTRPGGPAVLRVADVPEPVPGDDDVLVRVRAASLNPTDTNKRAGTLRVMYLREPRPWGMGMDVAGEVLAVGPAVPDVRVGDRVLGMTRNGDGFADTTVVRGRDAVVLPAEVDFPQAAAIAMSGSTARVIQEKMRLRPNSRVLVNGAAGGIGHFLAQLLVRDGHDVTGTASGDGLDVLRALGLAEVLDYHRYDRASVAGRFAAVVDLSGKLDATAGRAMLTDTGVFRTTVPGLSTMLAAVTTGFRAQRVGPIFAFATAAASRHVAGLVGAREITVTIGAERPLADAIATIRAVESGALTVPGKVVLTATGQD